MSHAIPMPMQRASSLLLAIALVLGAMVPLVAPSIARASSHVWINEIHYDNDGTDTGEAIEVAGAAGTDLTGWSIVLYNGSTGAVYDTDALSGLVPNQQNGFGTVVLTYPSNGIQNGAPDGIALVDASSAVVQFLSYEGSFIAVGGAADGLTSTDIGVAQTDDGMGLSLQLTGTGTTYESFTWESDPMAHTFGAINAGQSFGTDPQPQVDCGAPVVTPVGVQATTTVSASDATGTVIDLSITDSEPADPNITIGDTTPASADGGTATATVTVGAATPAGTYAVQITATNDDATPQTGTCTLSVTVEGPVDVPTGVVISQVYGGGGNAGAFYTHDFIELFNRTDAAIAIDGWSVQYASTAGTTWTATVLNGTIPAGGYYLIQQAAGTGGTQALPAPDASGGIAMSGNNGKVALSGGVTPLIGACPTSETIDLVGYGTANCFEGSGPAPGLVNTTAAHRAMAGCQDTNHNAADFATASPTPRNSASLLNPCGADQAPSVSSTTPADGSVNVQESATVTVEFSEAVNVVAGWYGIACTVSGAHAASVTGGPTTFVLDPDSDFVSGDQCTVTILAAGVTDQDTEDPPDNMDANYVFSFSVGDVCGNASHFIHEVQGDGFVSRLEGQDVTVEGVVIGTYQGDDPGLDGFYIQEEDADADDNPLTSEGVFIYDPGTTTSVAVGDVVSVSGSVTEFEDLTEISDVVDVSLCQVDAPLTVTPTELSFPVEDVNDLERFEGMLVSFEQTLTVTENFGLGRFGEVVLSANGRQYQGTHSADTGTPAEAVIDLNMRSRITLDDGDGSQNDDPTRYPTGGLSAENTLRIGATVNDLTAVLTWGFDLYRLQPVGELDFQDAADRPATPPHVGGSMQVAAFNVLNYFNGDGAGDFTDPDNRGANNQFEFDRQRDKIIEAIATMDAEVVGLMEIENDDSRFEYAAIEDLVDGLNAELGAGTYDFIETGTIGTDAIAVAIIYQPGLVSPLGDFAILDSSVDPRFDDTANRPMLAQTFTETASGASFTVAVNHLKSKGSGCGGAPDDQPDSGGGNCNGTRTLAAEAIVDWMADDPTRTGEADAIVIGDLNSYAMEDPIDVLKAGGYTDLLWDFQGPDEYTYVFFGASGYLDHALSNASMTDQVTGAAAWHINTDEPPVLDYNEEFKSENHVETLYDDGPFRSSDHDPVLVGLNLVPHAPEITSLEVTELVEVGESVQLSATFTEADGGETHTATIDWGDGSTSPGDVDQDAHTVTATHTYTDAGIYTVTLTVTDSGGLSAVETFEYVIVYDPAAGFVTGGGRIDIGDDTASFSISLKYKKTGDVPEGDVSFELPDLAFTATSYDWLVVDGSRAWTSGEGTVNGEDGYAFLLAVTDEPDRLRMKIWDVETGEVVFDNQAGDPIDAEASEPIRNGQIKVHEDRGPGARGGQRPT